MRFDYTKIPDKTSLIHALPHKKIVNLKSELVNLQDPALFDTIQNIGWKMVKTCVSDNGVGLAAPQFGILKCFFIIIGFENSYLWKFNNNFNLYINPKIIPVKDTVLLEEIEGCLSIPDKKLPIIRPQEIDLNYWYFDDNKKLKNTIERIGGFPARIIQHEYDHLIGKTIIELHLQQKKGRKTKGGK